MKNKNISRFVEKYSIFIVLAFMVVLCSLMSENFLSVNNFKNVARQLSVSIIIAYGEMLLVIAGLIDLSVGSVLALSGILSIAAYQHTGSLVIGFIVAIVVGVLCNLVNAVLVTNFKMPPFIATLAVQMSARGAALYYTHGQNLLQLKKYTVFGQGSLGPIPNPIIFMLIITAITWYIVNHTRYGRSLYAIGGNEGAAIASGINVNRSKYLTYIINGVFAGIAGVLFMSRVNAGLPNGAVGYEMEGLTATIVGGTSFSGGVGTTMGTLVGAFIIGFLNNIMNLTGVDSYVQQMVKGGIIAFAVAYDILSKNKKTRKVIVVEDDGEKKSKQQTGN
ncbi:ABC transporter permease [Suipraeoptans intestinalis]|uniref:ABC transporter permease n=1 Tax=Suipraeoptans intestinalis TaxID=2606628 RepID=UPI0023F19006|nr:ABC transporter permease [Suipraeoptans intestinalis]MDD7771074.1 ABC transporter permease [Suipraeoptans intestinalis]MDY3121589.1 ABC transporter permease [Suipraeoptans intestinalis]